MPHRLVPKIPDDLLLRENASRLERWCVNRGFRPSLLDVENERVRRGVAKGTGRPAPKRKAKGRPRT